MTDKNLKFELERNKKKYIVDINVKMIGDNQKHTAKVNNYIVKGCFYDLEETKKAVEKFVDMMETKWQFIK